MVRIWREGDDYAAADDQALVHAFGATKEEASANLVDSLREHRRLLNDLGDEHLAPHLRRVRALLNERAKAGES